MKITIKSIQDQIKNAKNGGYINKVDRCRLYEDGKIDFHISGGAYIQTDENFIDILEEIKDYTSGADNMRHTAEIITHKFNSFFN